MDSDIAWYEIQSSISNMKRGKSCGYDNLPVEIFRNYKVKCFLIKLFNKCFNLGIVPDMWNMSIIVPIPKCFNKDIRDPSNSRGISVASAVYKLYCSVLNNRLVDYDEQCNMIIDNQNGFRKSRSCIDHLSSLTSIVESRMLQKRSTFVAYIDFRKAYDCISRDKLWFKLDKLGLKGNSRFTQALKSLYQDVQCSVRLRGVYSNWFHVNMGLKQGCLLSPCLFNIYINDLGTRLGALQKGVKLSSMDVSVLLYADDLVLVAECEHDLQCMLDELNDWCTTWCININEQKSKVMHFRNKNINVTKKVFRCGNQNLEVCSKYKYLGLMLDEFLDYEVTAKHVSTSAHRALGLLIAKDKCHGGFDYDIFTKLYDSMVSSIIEYGAAIWGHRSYSCIDAVQYRACRYYLGLGKRAPIRAIQGDMGWKLPYERQWLCIIRHWLRLSNMDSSKLSSKIFTWSVLKASLNVKNWSFRVLQFLKSHKMYNVADIKSEVYYVHVKKDLVDKLAKYIENEWLTDINRLEGKNGQGQNKLRTYRMFKQCIYPETYVTTSLCKKYRRALASFRAGVAQINIELQRYGLAKAPLEERKCISCDHVESESHVLLHCPLYLDIRENFYQMINVLCDTDDDVNFSDMNEEQKMCFILGNPICCKYSARTCFEILERRKVLMYV